MTRRSGARSAVAFLTAVGGAAPPAPGAVVWFGPVGLVVGAVVGAVWWGTAQVAPASIAAAVALAVDLGLTGFLHVDGLADSGDGLLPPLDRARRLAIMRQPDVGAFGLATVVVVLLLRWSAFAALVPALADRPFAAVAVVGGLWALARGAMACGLGWLPYARSEGGLASAFGGVGAARLGAVAAALLGAASAAAGLGGNGAAAAAGTAAGGAAVLALARRRLGGYTGDVLGATGMVAETLGLVVAAALLA